MHMSEQTHHNITIELRIEGSPQVADIRMPDKQALLQGGGCLRVANMDKELVALSHIVSTMPQ